MPEYLAAVGEPREHMDIRVGELKRPGLQKSAVDRIRIGQLD